MEIRDFSFEEFTEYIENYNRKIVVFGAGVICKSVLPHFIMQSGMGDVIGCVVDGDVKKQGDDISLGDREFVVCPPEAIKKAKNAVVLITASRYKGIVDCLEGMGVDAEVFLFPLMLERRSRNLPEGRIESESKTPAIPKKIHYCWFGEKEIPDELKRYMESWGKYCPDYEIIGWGEDNYDLNRFKYTRQAYDAGKLGFVPDLVRLDVLEQYGGIYLDTDVELIRSLDGLLGLQGFISTEKWGLVNAGGGCGAVPHHPMIKEMLEYRKNVEFVRDDGSLNLESSGTYETLPLIKHGFRPDNSLQEIEKLTVLTSDYFHPYDYMTHETRSTNNTIGIHHFFGSWVE